AHAAWSKPIPRNQWVHIKATYDNKEIRVYVNGELSGRKEFVSPLSAGGRIAIGNALDVPRPFAGMIDDVRIINQPQ
ncbi:MAG: LamG domain-containing protein, partial [Planctomycetes bacterium]|nr:LamG domain-containing protein [Planctomycetota bacterium]